MLAAGSGSFSRRTRYRIRRASDWRQRLIVARISGRFDSFRGQFRLAVEHVHARSHDDGNAQPGHRVREPVFLLLESVLV